MEEAKVSKLQKKLKSGQERLSPEKLEQVKELITERKSRIAESLRESRARDEAFYARQDLLAEEERNALNDLMEKQERDMALQSAAFAAHAEYLKKRRAAKAQIIIYSAASRDRLTFHAAERMAERGISTLDVMRENVTVIKRPNDGQRNVIITAYGCGSLSKSTTDNIFE